MIRVVLSEEAQSSIDGWYWFRIMLTRGARHQLRGIDVTPEVCRVYADAEAFSTRCEQNLRRLRVVRVQILRRLRKRRGWEAPAVACRGRGDGYGGAVATGTRDPGVSEKNACCGVSLSFASTEFEQMLAEL